jgi:hypothetical protein
MRAIVLLVAVAAGLPVQQDGGSPPSLDRLAREAQAFADGAPDVVGRETLAQKALLPPRRFRIRVGEAATRASEPRYRTRTIVSEYGFAPPKNGSGELFELRQVDEVDGKPVQSRGEARRRLYSGLKSGSDRTRKRMLEDFEKYGLKGAITGLGQSILLFLGPRQADFRFRPAGTVFLGAEKADMVTFEQVKGPSAVTVFEQHQVKKFGLQGRVWLREADGVPLRIEFSGSREVNDLRISDVETVDYQMSRFGFLLPARARHRETVLGTVTMENEFRYEDFRKFSANSSIQFETDSGKPPGQAEASSAPPWR